MLTVEQRRFLTLFVTDGEFNLMTTCQATGIVPSIAIVWFRDDAFQKALRQYEHAQLLAMGYGPLRVMRDTLDIAHSDISEVMAYAANLHEAPRRIRVAVKKVKMGVAVVDGRAVPYCKEIEMVGKEWALKQAAEWYNVGEAPEVKAAQATVTTDDGPKRITGLVVRPPLTKDEKEIEDMLK